MANEEIDAQNVVDKTVDKDIDPVITVFSNNKQSRIKIRAKPIPNEITALLDRSTDLLKVVSQHIKTQQGLHKNDKLESKLEELQINGTKNKLSDRMIKLIQTFKDELQTICDKLGPEWKDIVKQIWSVGPRNCGPNLLLNQTEDYRTKYLHHEQEIKEDPRFEYESSFVNGFQLASLAGPLCDEPMMGVAFCVEEWSLDKSAGDDMLHFGPLSGKYCLIEIKYLLMAPLMAKTIAIYHEGMIPRSNKVLLGFFFVSNFSVAATESGFDWLTGTLKFNWHYVGDLSWDNLHMAI